jgi:hypothetical protein
MFGNWTNNLKTLNSEFDNSEPIRHVVIRDFFSEEWANTIHDIFPLPDKTWKFYNDPIERRFTLNNLTPYPDLMKTVESIHNPKFIKLMESITGIKNVIIDPNYQDGTGLQAIPRDGKLSIHLDYSINKQSGKERRFNLLIYMNKNWDSSYGGALQLGTSPSTCKDIVSPSWNTAIIFESTPLSYHGIPDDLKCPPGEYRKSLGLYFSSDTRESSEMRYRGVFYPPVKPNLPEKLLNLYTIRKSRILNSDDLLDWGTWREEGW